MAQMWWKKFAALTLAVGWKSEEKSKLSLLEKLAIFAYNDIPKIGKNHKTQFDDKKLANIARTPKFVSWNTIQKMRKKIFHFFCTFL